MARRSRAGKSSGPARFVETLEERSLFSVTLPHAATHAAAAHHSTAAQYVTRHYTAAKHAGSNKLGQATQNIHIVPDVTNTVASGYTPAKIAHAYGFDKTYFSNGTVKGNGAGQTIAIVDAYDDPSIYSDVNTFSAQFGLPAMNGQSGNPTFSKLTQSGITQNSGWAMETALDVEWAHAMAPKANIVLIESADSSLSNLLAGVNAARNMTSASVVSMSWGGGEFSSETYYDSYFTTPSGHTPMTFVASSGDSGAPVSWPSISPNVLSVGGTSLTTDSYGNYVSESGWTGSGGGGSWYEYRPSYQNNVVASAGRVNPDVAYNADPNHGYAVYNSVTQSNGHSGWFQVGGTSAAAPQWAALVAIANQGRATVGKATLNGRSQVLPALYYAPSSDFHDVTTGYSNGSPQYAAGPGYDAVTGLGTPHAELVTGTLVNT